MGGYKEIVIWLAVAAAAAPIWGAGLLVLWQGVVRPHLISRGEVERLAALLVERYGERAAEVAFAKENSERGTIPTASRRANGGVYER